MLLQDDESKVSQCHAYGLLCIWAEVKGYLTFISSKDTTTTILQLNCRCIHKGLTFDQLSHHLNHSKIILVSRVLLCLNLPLTAHLNRME